MNLTQKVLCYQKRRWCLGNILIDIRKICQNWLRRRKAWSEEEIDDFFDFVRPKLIRMINRYKYERVQFGRYLAKTLHFQVRSYIMSKSNSDMTQRRLSNIERIGYQEVRCGNKSRTSVSDQLWPESVAPADELIETNPDRNFSLTRDGIPELEDIRDLDAGTKRILLLALKKVEFWDDSDLHRLSSSTGIPEIQLLGMRMKAFSLNEKNIERRNLLRERRNGAFFNLQKTGNDVHKQKKLLKSYGNTQDQISRLMVSPSHKELAELTGIPKGTVDSNLFNHKSRCLKDIS